MAQTLEEFLVSVKYAVDEPSQQKFFAGLKRFATSIGGVVAELTLLSTGLVELSAKLAQHGDALYWMSQRLETSIGSIEAASYAMAGFGVSVNDAQSAMEKLGYWQRSMGPAATQYMRTLGITSRDAAIQLEQAGQRLLALRPGSIEYAIELQRLQMMGIDERQALAAGRAAPESERNERMLAQMWGTGAGGSREQMRARLAAQTDEYGKASNQLVVQFNRMGLFFETLSQKFALGLFKAIGPDLDKLNALLLQMQPHFERLMNLIIGYGPQLMGFLEGFIKATATFVDMLAQAVDWIEKLPPAVKHGAEAMLELKIGMSLLASPLGRFITMFILFMSLLDDYQQWQENQKPGARQVKTLFDWGKFDEIAKPLEKIGKEFDQWVEHLTGIKDPLEWLLGAVVAAKILGLAGNFASVTKAVGSLTGAMLRLNAVTLAGIGIFALWALVASLKGDTAPLSPEDQRKLTERNKQEEDDYKRQHGGRAPDAADINKRQGYTGDVLHDTGQMFRNLWDYLNKQFPSPPEPGTTDAAKPPVETKSDHETKSFLRGILDWGKEAADGISKLVRFEQDKEDMAQGLRLGVTPEAAAASPGGVAGAGSALTGGGPMTTQQAFDAAFMRDDLMKRFAAAGHPISQEAASEIVSASKFESGLHSDIRYGGGAYDYGGTDAVGLFQETGSRHAKLERFAKEHGLDPKTYEAQIQNFMDDVLNNPVFSRGFDEALRIHNFGGHYEATSGNVHGADPWQHGRWTEQINRLPPSTANSSGATDVSRQPPRTQPNASNQQSFNYSTSITVQSPDPNLAGQKVAAEMQRIYDFQTRHAESRLA